MPCHRQAVNVSCNAKRPLNILKFMRQKSFLTSLLLIVCLIIKAQSISLNGTWQFSFDDNEVVQRVDLTNKKDSVFAAFSGLPSCWYCNMYFAESFRGSLQKSKIQFHTDDFKYEGFLKDDTHIEGAFIDKNGITHKWTAIKEVAERKPSSFSFNPKVYYRKYSSYEAPILRLVSGDTVRTSTVDASGTDNNSKAITLAGNPLTGPFYIENAMPGDAIAIKLIKVKTNRDYAFSGVWLIDNALEPNYLTSRKYEAIDNIWLINKDSNFLKMKSPSERLKNYRIPLTPFLGCIGVASSMGTGVYSSKSGNFGGNMEDKMMTDGATLYLPVFVQGGYLYVGDGHAAQGDGELTGNAMETSMDVVFSVELVRNKHLNAPRVETKDFIKSIGIAGSLDQAVKIATTDLTLWLKSEYNLSDAEAAIIMGFSVEYNIPDLVDKDISITAKIPKQILKEIKRN